MRIYRYISIILIVVFSCSCDFTKRKVKNGFRKVVKETADVLDDFFSLPDRTLKRDVLDNELYGDWVITEESLFSLNKQQSDYPNWQSITYPSLRFTLKKDSTVEAWIFEQYLPISFYKYPVTVVDSVLITGKWLVGKDLYCSDTTSVYKNELQMYFDCSGIVRFNIAEQEREILLWSYIGDPDLLYYQEYKNLNH